ncbi:hypothetical protein ACVR1I_06620 [Streptococcus cameli]
MKLITVEVTESFKDKATGTLRQFGEVFEVSDERFRQLAGENSYNRPFVKKVSKDDASEVEEATQTEDLSKLSVTKLQALLTERGIAFKKSANKTELLELLG